METQNHTFSEKDSLALIHQMIASAKNEIKDDGFLYLLWGYLVFAAAITHYILIQLGYKYNYIPWPVLMITGAVISIIYGMKQSKKVKVKTYVDTFMGYLWGAFMVALLIVLGFSWKLGISTYPLIIVIYGIGTFVSGGALKFRPLIIGGALCWVIAIISFFMNFEMQLLLLALSILVSYIIPGHLLQWKYNKAHV